MEEEHNVEVPRISLSSVPLATAPEQAATGPTERRRPLESHGTSGLESLLHLPNTSDNTGNDLGPLDIQYVDIIFKFQSILRKSRDWGALHILPEGSDVVSSLQTTLVDLRVWAYDLSDPKVSLLEYLRNLPSQSHKLKTSLQGIFSDIGHLLRLIEDETYGYEEARPRAQDYQRLLEHCRGIRSLVDSLKTLKPSLSEMIALKKERTLSPERPPRFNPPIVLTFDGGGVKSYASLLILKALMQYIRDESAKQLEIPSETVTRKPCEIFDFIFGSSSGGLIAIMLGRLEMTVEECIEKYCAHSNTVFTRSGLRTRLRRPFTAPKYDEATITQATRRLVGHFDPTPGHEKWKRKVFGALHSPCKTGVLATSVLPHATSYMFRTYDCRVPLTSENLDWKPLNPGPASTHQIWEVARATSAAPTYFPPIHLDDNWFVDGGVTANNPTQEALREVAFLHEELSGTCVVSIGSGISNGPILPASLLRGKRTAFPRFKENLRVLREAVTQTELTNTDVHFEASMNASFQYFRFNTENERDIRLDDWDASGKTRAEIERSTEIFIKSEKTRSQMRQCASEIVARMAERQTYAGIVQIPGHPYARTIATAIENKMRDNWEGRKYIPWKDLEQILTKDTISKLIRADETLRKSDMLILTGGTKLAMDDFINETWLWRMRLLALCVYADLPLNMLYHMQRNGLEDKDIPLAREHCPAESDKRLFDRAADLSGCFAAHIFTPVLEHQRLSPGAVVPIIFDKNDPKYLLGKGSFGNLYKVHVDRDHNFFTESKDEPFALKIFHNPDAHTQMEIENESATLVRLAKAPHPNITSHLASWNQNEVCFMLFRCADCNLRTHMAQKSPLWTKSNLLALIGQMRGLADGLRVLHLLRPSGVELDRVEEELKPGQTRKTQTYFHHNLSPTNILLIKHPDTKEFLFSISDIESVRIGQFVSGSEESIPFAKNLSLGDAAYEAPDADLKRETYHPYDMWSIGCIFLELLTWIVGLEDDSVQRFAVRRLESAFDFRGNQDQAFWYWSPGGRVSLKPAVVRQLEVLKERCAGRGVFPSLVRTVGKLLRIIPNDRPKAALLVRDLDAIMIQVHSDLENENFYIDRMPTRYWITTPPSSVGDSDDLSRMSSMGKREIPAQYGDNLMPGHRANRRSTTGATNANLDQSRLSVHRRYKSALEAGDTPQYLAPLWLDVAARVPVGSLTPTDERPNTPRISLSDFDRSARDEALWHIGREDDRLPPSGSQNANFEPDLHLTVSSGSRWLDL